MKSRYSVAAFLLVALLASAFFFAGRDGVKRIPMKIAITTHLSAGLIKIAETKGFFEQQGLKVTIVPYLLGLEAIDALVRDEVEYAVAFDTAIASQMVKHENLRILAQVFSSPSMTAVLYRNDSGVSSPVDFAGKRVGGVKNTASEFVIDQLLSNAGLGEAAYEFVEVPVAGLENALMTGQVAAISLWEPNVSLIQDRHFDQVTRLQSGSLTQFLSLIARADPEGKRTKATVLLLRALIAAEAWAEANSTEAHRIAENLSGLQSHPNVLRLWDGSALHVSLDSAFTRTMDAQLEWFARKLKWTGVLPKTTDFVERRYLESVDKKRVNLD